MITRSDHLTWVAWLLLAIIAVLLVLFPLLDVAGILKMGIPSDHTAAFRMLSGEDFTAFQSTGPAAYVRQFEFAYALHELTFGLFFLVIVLVPLRDGDRWAWWSCWIVLIAYVGYTITFAHYSSTTVVYSLVPDVAIPILLLVIAPHVLTKRA
jgi:hypothetical protein